MLLGTSIAAGRKKGMKTWQKINSSTNLGLPIDMEKGRAFTGVHGVDQVIGSGPNAFPVEVASGNDGIGGTEVLPGHFWKWRRRAGERRLGGRGEWTPWREDPHPGS
jgi:hypothetical protein